MIYTPDKWVLVRITNNSEVTYIVFAGWYGGYTSGDSWKMNSGIVKSEFDGEYYTFYGESSSIYKCHKDCYGMSRYMERVLELFTIQNTSEVFIEVAEKPGEVYGSKNT